MAKKKDIKDRLSALEVLVDTMIGGHNALARRVDKLSNLNMRVDDDDVQGRGPLWEAITQVMTSPMEIGTQRMEWGFEVPEGGDAIQEREAAEEKEEGVGRPRFARSLTWDMALTEVSDDLLELRLSGEYSFMYSHMDEREATQLRDALNEWLATKGTTDASQDDDQSSIDARSDDDPPGDDGGKVNYNYFIGGYDFYPKGAGIIRTQLKGTDG